MNFKRHLSGLMLIIALRPAAGVLFAEAPPVKCLETESAFTLDNGILHAEIEKRSGNLSSLTFYGKELLAQSGGYWSLVGHGSGRVTPGHTASIIQNSPERVEISCRLGNLGGQTNIPMDSDFRYSLGRGESAIHVTAILHHSRGNPGYSTGESRYCLKLNPQVFDFLSVDANRQRLMPSGYDWDHGAPLNLKEARRMTTGIHKGEVEHKYDYSAALAEIPAYGWFGTKSHVGLWLINPSQEYIGGGPTKVELTGHLDVNDGGTPTLLNMWQGSHYGGTSLEIGLDEDWTKVVGPFAVYCNNSASSLDARKDALARAASESARWPYAWFRDTNYPPAAIRGTVAGKIILRDAFVEGAKMSNVWVGIAAPEYLPPTPHFDRQITGEKSFFAGWRGTNFSPVSPTNWLGRNGFPLLIDWQRDAKFYQFWTHADADGNFEIRNVRPGTYDLHAFGEGVMGELTMTNITLSVGEKKSLGKIVWHPSHFGKPLWQIGIPDRTAREFRHGDHYWQWGLYYQYPQDFPDDIHFIIGQSDWRKDWNYVQPPRILNRNHGVISEEEAPNEAHRTKAPFERGKQSLENSIWRIQFQITEVPQGKATLRLAFAGARDGSILEVRLNLVTIGNTGLLPATGVMHRDGIQGYWFERDLTFDCSRFMQGTNIFELEAAANNWTQGILYDCIQLELDDSSKTGAK